MTVLEAVLRKQGPPFEKLCQHDALELISVAKKNRKLISTVSLKASLETAETQQILSLNHRDSKFSAHTPKRITPP